MHATANEMIRAIVIFAMALAVRGICTVSHEELWSCAFHKCVNAYQLHALASKHGKSYQRPFILAMEGPKYKRLYRDCDTNNDGCIDLDDLKKAGDKCQRSCMWRTTMKDLLC